MPGLELKEENDLDFKEFEHRYGKNQEIVCLTEVHGPETGPDRIVIGLGDRIPLWTPNSTLYWKFDDRSMQRFKYPDQAKDHFRELIDGAMSMWGDAAPVKFAEAAPGSPLTDIDFLYGLTHGNDCNPNGGCVLASAFFPSQNIERLWIFPKLLDSSKDYQFNVMAHELGHIFGLRHYFAQEKEAKLPAVIFGEHSKFSIMNYGGDSILTEVDRRDLALFYMKVWNREITHIGDMSVDLVIPRSSISPSHGYGASVLGTSPQPIDPVEDIDPVREDDETIKVNMSFSQDINARIKGFCNDALSRWQQIIKGGLVPYEDQNGNIIEEIKIRVEKAPIDGNNGKLAEGMATLINPHNFLPLEGFIRFDENDLNDPENSDELFMNIVLHELGHVLGLSSYIWEVKNLVSNTDQDEPIFIGENAIGEYAELTGEAVNHVPLADTGSSGTMREHLNERVFGNELMTGELGEGYSPISRLTISMLEDIGYTVNYATADAYSLPEAGDIVGFQHMNGGDRKTCDHNFYKPKVAPVFSNKVS